MNKERSLKEALLNCPDDDSLRLAYAAWLDTRKDPLGEFIRVQCQLESTRPWQEGWVPLKVQSTELLIQHRTAWEAPVEEFLAKESRFAGRYAAEILRRGLPEFVQVQAETFLAHHERIFRAAPIRHIRVENSKTHLTQLLNCPSIARVRNLELGSSLQDPLDGEDFKAIAACRNLSCLQRLSLRGADPGPSGIAALVSSPNFVSLTELDLTDNQLGDAGVQSLATHMKLPQLSRLVLSQNDLGAQGAETLASHSWLEQLKALSLKDNERLKDKGVLALTSSSFLGSLQSLDLSLCSFGIKGARALATAPSLKRLIAAILPGNDIKDTGARELAGASYLSCVRQLNLRRCYLGPGGASKVVASPHLAQVGWLDLSSTGADDTVLFALREAPLINQLRVLDLSGNVITDQGIFDLTKADVTSPLARLELRETAITHEGVLALIACPSFDNLVSVDLTDVRLDGDALAEALGASPSTTRLREIRLNGINLGNKGALALARSPYLSSVGVLTLFRNAIGSKGKEELQGRFGPRVLF